MYALPILCMCVCAHSSFFRSFLIYKFPPSSSSFCHLINNRKEIPNMFANLFLTLLGISNKERQSCSANVCKTSSTHVDPT